MDQCVDDGQFPFILWLVMMSMASCCVPAQYHRSPPAPYPAESAARPGITPDKRQPPSHRYRQTLPKALRQRQQLLHRAKPAAKLKSLVTTSFGNRQAAARHRGMIAFKTQGAPGLLAGRQYRQCVMPRSIRLLGRHRRRAAIS